MPLHSAASDLFLNDQESNFNLGTFQHSIFPNIFLFVISSDPYINSIRQAGQGHYPHLGEAAWAEDSHVIAQKQSAARAQTPRTHPQELDESSLPFYNLTRRKASNEAKDVNINIILLRDTQVPEKYLFLTNSIN